MKSALKLATTGFADSEFQARIQNVVNYVQAEGVDGYLVMDPYNVFYMGLYYMPGKRALTFYIHKSGKVYIFTPAMEAHEATKLAYVDRVVAYDDDYTEEANLFGHMKKVINADFGTAGSVVVDTVSDIDTFKALQGIFSNVRTYDYVMKLRQVKSAAEIEMLRLSGYYSDVMVGACRKHVKPGMSELGVLNRAITDTVDKMVEDGIQVIHVPGGPAGALIPSGVNTSKPHSLPSQRAVQMGENMLFSCGANVWGYRTESERTVFLGRPNQQAVEMFEVMREAQELGIKLMKPGAVCEEVELAVLDFITKAGYGNYVRHRLGHGKGLEEHEPPYAAAGDKTIMQPGMIFSSEPGLYLNDVIGVRHSDIVLVTETGSETLTNYPKALDDLILEF